MTDEPGPSDPLCVRLAQLRQSLQERFCGTPVDAKFSIVSDSRPVLVSEQASVCGQAAPGSSTNSNKGAMSSEVSSLPKFCELFAGQGGLTRANMSVCCSVVVSV